jgi:membrane protein DedA with SNARE-associated domain
MGNLLTLIEQHGYWVVFFVVLAEALGAPVPAALALIAGGAAAATGTLRGPGVFLVAVAGILLGDSLIYLLGRRMGWRLLSFLCVLSISPETCVLRSAELFYRRGRKTLLIAKFIPGINALAPPLAGSMRMPVAQFLLLDLAGASSYVFSYSALGYVFHSLVAAIEQGFATAGRVFEAGIALAIIAYIVYRIRLFRKNRIYRVVPRVQVKDVSRRLASSDTQKILIADVRSYGYYDAAAVRIKGAIRLEPNNIATQANQLPRDKDLYLYCT